LPISNGIPSDGILAATYAIGAVLTSGNLIIENVDHVELMSFYGALHRIGANFDFKDDILHIHGKQSLQAIPKLQTSIYPGFPTDIQSPFGVLLTRCQGDSLIFETLFENRLGYLFELEKMGAKIRFINNHQAEVSGITKLKGAEVSSLDLRAGCSMVLAGIIAEGETSISNIQYIKRGYENFVENMTNLGIKITEN
jgi:UDP-N-acetylglucosamine 1-carboxyvinyltransferase